MATNSESTADEDVPDLATDEVQKSLSVKFQTVADDVVEESCFSCSKKSSTLKTCTGCRVAKYCDRNCQANHWQEHKLECGDKAKGATKGSPSKSKIVVAHICMNCGKMSSSLKSCTRCWSVKYCNRECQKEHWTIHKPDCTENPKPRVQETLSKTDSIVFWSEAARLLQGEREMEILPEFDPDSDETEES